MGIYSKATAQEMQARTCFQWQDSTTMQIEVSNLTKNYKSIKDKLHTTGYGKGKDDEGDKETEGELELVRKHYQVMDKILGNLEVINPRHMLKSS